MHSMAPGREDSSVSRVQSTVSCTDDGWFHGARQAGTWCIDTEGSVHCGFTRGMEIRWRSSSNGEDVPAVEVVCSADGNAWAVDTNGSLWICGNPAESEKDDSKGIVTATYYENQRWRPYPPYWSDQLLPTDRPSFSDESGIKAQDRDTFELPSSRWEWLGNWEILVDPQHTDSEGWQYALDFPRAWSPAPRITDLVRRRALRRRRQVTKSAVWTYVEGPMVEAPKRSKSSEIRPQPAPSTAEPVVSVGVGRNAVWAVTKAFNIFFRAGVCAGASEGTRWRAVPAPARKGDLFSLVRDGKVEVSPDDVAWLVAPDGKVYIRKNAGSANPLGTKWSPVKGAINIVSICLGENQVWALDELGSMWSRSSVNAKRPEGKIWEPLMGPPGRRIVFISASPEPHMLLAVDAKGSVWERQGVTRGTPNGIGGGWGESAHGPNRTEGAGWAQYELHHEHKILVAAMSVGGVKRPEEIELPPLPPGPWSNVMRGLLRQRDSVERDTRRFGHYDTYNQNSAKIDADKRGVLLWRRVDSWDLFVFELDASKKTLSWRADSGDAEEELSYSVGVETLLAISNVEVEDLRCTWTQFLVEFQQRTLLVAAESKRDKEGWLLSLLTAHAKIAPESKQLEKVEVSKGETAPSATSIWAVDYDGQPWFCERSSLEHTSGRGLVWYPVNAYKQTQVSAQGVPAQTPGAFISIQAGPSGLVWGLGEDGRVYAHTGTFRGEAEWTRVPPPPSKTEEAPKGVPASSVFVAFSSIALGASCAWAVDRDGKVYVRWGTRRDQPLGGKWEELQPLNIRERFAAVRVSGNTVWGVLASSRHLVSRGGLSGRHPTGTHWKLCNGLVLADFNDVGGMSDHEIEETGEPGPAPLPSYTGLVLASALPRPPLCQQPRNVLASSPAPGWILLYCNLRLAAARRAHD